MDPVSHHDQEEDGDKRCSRCLQLLLATAACTCCLQLLLASAACVRCLLPGTDLALL